MKKHRSARAWAGFSLVEMLVALTIGSVLISGAVYIYSQSRKTFTVSDTVARLQDQARAGDGQAREPWPMIVLRTPKGWTGPVKVDGDQVEGTFRAHEVPLPAVRSDEEHLRALEAWLRSYRPEELFDAGGAPVGDLVALSPSGDRRMSANPTSNGGAVLRELDLPDFRDYAVEVKAPGSELHEPTRVLGGWLRDVVRRNPSTFLLFGPD